MEVAGDSHQLAGPQWVGLHRPVQEAAGGRSWGVAGDTRWAGLHMVAGLELEREALSWAHVVYPHSMLSIFPYNCIYIITCICIYTYTCFRLHEHIIHNSTCKKPPSVYKMLEGMEPGS